MDKWRPVVGYESFYEVSDAGAVRRRKSGRLLTPRIGTGYNQLALYANGVRKHKLAHVLVYEAFCGAIPAEMMINHKNGIKLDNRVENLEAVTASENTLHAYRVTNVMPRPLGEDHQNAKLTDDLVRVLRKEFADGMGYKALARKHGVNWSTAWMAIKRKTWRHID